MISAQHISDPCQVVVGIDQSVVFTIDSFEYYYYLDLPDTLPSETDTKFVFPAMCVFLAHNCVSYTVGNSDISTYLVKEQGNSFAGEGCTD